MSVNKWCKACVCPAEKCSIDTHKKDFVWRVDFLLGGRQGQRIRQCYDTRDLALAEEARQRTEFNRAGALPREKNSKILFSEIVDRYYKEHSLVENHEPKRGALHLVNLFKSELGRTPILLINRQTIKTLQTKWRAEGSKASTVNRRFNTLKAVFYKAMEWEIIDKNPCEFIEKLVEEEVQPRFLTKEEINLLWLTASKMTPSSASERLLDYMTVLLHTGARPSSIKSCSWDKGDVDLNARTIWFTTFKGRRKIHRYAHPIDDTLFTLLTKRAKLTSQKGFVFDTSGLAKLTRKLIKLSGINDNKSPDQQFTIYGLKHCYVSHLLMSGAKEDDVRKLVGHTDNKMIMKHYSHLTQEYLREVQSKVNLTPDAKPILKVI